MKDLLLLLYESVVAEIQKLVEIIRSTDSFDLAIYAFVLILFVVLLRTVLSKALRRARWRKYIKKREKGYRRRTKQIRITKRWEQEFYSSNNSDNDGVQPWYKSDAERISLEKEWQEIISKRIEEKPIYSLPVREKSQTKPKVQKTQNQSNTEDVVTYDLSGYEYEAVVARHFQGKGYKCKVTSKSGDFGADIIAVHIKSGKSAAVQCKFFGYGNKVGIDAVYQAIGGKEYYECDEAWVVTNSEYTTQAQVMAKKTGVKLKHVIVIKPKEKQ